MSDKWVELIAAAIVTLTQLYVMEPWKFPVFAKFWDAVATWCGKLANTLANFSMQARLNYFTAVNTYGN